MVTVPERCAVPVLAATTTLTLALPVPLPLEPSVSQDALLVAVHAHVLPVVRVTSVVSPAVGDVRIAGVSAYEHVGTPACVTVKVCPAIVTVPMRCVALVLAATTTFTVPSPVPVPPDPIVSQALLLVASQAQVLPAVTATATVSPAAGAARFVGVSAYVQVGTPDWVTLRVWSAIVTVPVRCAVPVLAATMTSTLPSPVPPDPTLSHAALLVVLQAQVLPAVTATATLSPAAGEVRLVGAIVNVHGAPACVTLKVWPAIVTDPVRCAVPVFAATVTLTLPLPVLPDPTVNHAALLVVLHAQVLPVVTATATLSPAAGEVRLVGAIVNVHGVPAWVTLKLWPAIVTDPVRCAVPVFAATVTLTLPLPVLPDPTVNHAALLVVLHAHVLPVVTATATLSPPAGDVRLVGAIVNVHGVPACVTLNVWPAIVTDPVRCAVPVFAATVTLTVPLPVLPDPTVNHAALLVVLHAHVLTVVTATATLSPPAGDVRLVGAIVNVQRRAGLGDAEGLAGNRHRSGALRGPGIRGDGDVDAAVASAAANPHSTTRRCCSCSTAQVLPAVTATVTDSPAAGELRLVGVIANVQGRPSWVTVNVWPAMVMVPVRCAVPVFAATMTPTVPLPVPVAPEPIVNHAALLVVLQAQVLPAVTPTATGSPPAGEVRLVGAIVNVHGVPAWVTLNVWPAIVTEPVRCAVPVFAATVTLTVPLPVLPDPTVNHAALLVVLHAHVLPVVTATATLSPPRATCGWSARS